LQVLGPTPRTFSKQIESDALGRVTSICEISSSLPGVGTCTQTSRATGWWTKYDYSSTSSTHSMTVTQNAQSSPTQTRTYTYDAANRLTQEVNPENGTVSYTYDTMPTGCPSSGTSYTGDLVAITKNGTLSNCFKYDKLHRKTFAGKTGPTCRHFIYDSATVNGMIMSYPAGRLAEAKTDNCSSTAYTDEGFSYDTRGNQTDFYESTPNSGAYYHVGATFWANGTLETLSGLSLPVLTYNPDGMGRVASVSASKWTTPVASGVSYNAFSEPTSAAFGSSDVASFSYNGNTGNMTKATETINGSAVSETTSWGLNRTVVSTVTNNTINTADNKTCNYTYNDVAVLASIKCGSGNWGQTFTYDAFGNVTKAVPSGYTGLAWQPGYSPSTNRYTLSGTSYDTNGNLLADTFHNYTWDQNHGDMLTLDSASMTYDAFGRQVEMTNGSTHTQFVYAFGKRLAIMNGQTETNAFVPLVGGTDGQYNSSGIVAYRVSDWRGSRIIGSSPSRTYTQGADYAPFGETEWSIGSGQKVFAEISADTVFDESDAHARKQHPTQGRWVSPDPVSLSAVDPTNPQTWNRYAYVANSPLDTINPSGTGDPHCSNPQIRALCVPDQLPGNPLFQFAAGGALFGAWGDEFDLLEIALTPQEVPDPSKPSLTANVCDNNGCEIVESPQMKTVYPNIGLLSLLSVTGGGGEAGDPSGAGGGEAANNGQQQQQPTFLNPTPAQCDQIRKDTLKWINASIALWYLAKQSASSLTVWGLPVSGVLGAGAAATGVGSIPGTLYSLGPCLGK
jgi:RHS repeat-associated protein